MVCGDWRQKSRPAGRRMGSRVGGEGVRKPKCPSPPFSDPQRLVCKMRLLRYVPSVLLDGRTDCLKIKIKHDWGDKFDSNGHLEEKGHFEK